MTFTYTSRGACVGNPYIRNTKSGRIGVSHDGKWRVRFSKIARARNGEVVVPCNWVDTNIIWKRSLRAEAKAVRHAHEVWVHWLEFVCRIRVACQKLEGASRVASSRMGHRSQNAESMCHAGVFGKQCTKAQSGGLGGNGAEWTAVL